MNKDNMNIIKFTGVAVAILLFVTATGNGEDKLKKKSCKEHPMLSGDCFKVTGRMFLSNGTPSIRIWPVGTKRILGISEGRFYLDDYGNVPDELVQQLSWKTAIYADFTVCPFTNDKPGVMRLVCVESAKNVSIREWK